MKRHVKRYIIIAVLSLLAAQAVFTAAKSSTAGAAVEFCSDFGKTQINI